MTMMMSDLPRDLLAEILCRVPITSLRRVRSTCKKWDALSKTRIFGKSSSARNQFLGFLMMDSRVCSLRFDLQGIRKDGELAGPSIKQVSILNHIEVSKLFHCDGLLLCVIKDKLSLMVWNPYLGQTKWIQPRTSFHRLDVYALGYDKNSNHKILRFFDYLDYNEVGQPYDPFGIEIYDLGCNSWRVLDITPDWDIEFYQRGVDLKGNTFFFAREKLTGEGVVGDDEVDTTELQVFLLCFDFTTEKFGPRLTLPFHSILEETVTLGCVRGEQLAVLYQLNSLFTAVMEIWVTTKIQTNQVLWSHFLKVDMRPLTGFKFYHRAGSFFINNDKKAAVVFDLDGYKRTETCRYQTAYIVGQDGYFKSVNIGEALNLGKPDIFGYTSQIYCVPLVCSSSYVPSLVQIIN